MELSGKGVRVKSNVTTTNNMWWGINRIVKQVKAKFFGQQEKKRWVYAFGKHYGITEES